jgi:hypothetical protein
VSIRAVRCLPARGLQKKEKENKEQKNNPKKQPTNFPSFFLFFLGAPCVGCGPSGDMPPHVGTRTQLIAGSFFTR